MANQKRIRIALLALTFGLTAMSAQAADQWYFHVKNATSSNITGLEVSSDGKSWGKFDVGSGIAPGELAKMNWAPSTNDSPCEQSIRAKFADGTTSPPSKQDFCKDLEEPIIFTEG